MGDFNTQKGAFLLVAAVVATQMIITIIIVTACLFLTVPYCENLREPMIQMFQMAFTAAVAFAGGRMSAPQPPSPKLPETKQEQGEPKDER